MFTEVYTWFDALDDLTHYPRRDCWAWHSWRMPSKGGVRNTKHEDPAWGAYRVLSRTPQSCTPCWRNLSPQG